MTFNNEDKEMAACIIRHIEKELKDLQNDSCGHQEIVSDMKESCHKRIEWLENLLHRAAQEDEEKANTRIIELETYKKLKEIGILDTSVRAYNRGTSDYSRHIIQPWTIWQDYNLNPWDADIVKRILRTKQGDSRRLDYEKIIHICEERIRQIDTGGLTYE